ncbi:conserved hypothetical protein [Acidithiobacillus caldus SM-1]|uniref:Uncharacterized protein n=2 Tax=Acidithiobacillus caldus TaxID=33059 RepID=F9ZSR8_ACICS|nr:conserved hypothetical protein [Acidithiobacillus caldus SM-1]
MRIIIDPLPRYRVAWRSGCPRSAGNGKRTGSGVSLG